MWAAREWNCGLRALGDSGPGAQGDESRVHGNGIRYAPSTAVARSSIVIAKCTKAPNAIPTASVCMGEARTFTPTCLFQGTGTFDT